MSYVVGTQPVILIDAEQSLSLLVNEDDALTTRSQSLHAILQLLYLVHVRLGAQRGKSRSGERCLGIHLGAFSLYSVNLITAGQEEYGSFFFPYPIHLTMNGGVLQTVQLQLSPCVRLQITDVVVATRPDDVLGISENSRNTGNSRRMNHMPYAVVVIQQTFEVSHINGSVSTRYDVEVHVVTFILRSGEVTEERNALCPCTSHSCHHHDEAYYQFSHGCASFPIKVSYGMF